MSANSFGTIFKVTTFGESHGNTLGCVIDGCPAGVDFMEDLLLHELERRRPGQHKDPVQAKDETSAIVSQRKEEDQPELLSGIFQGKTLGTPIALMVRNKDQRSEDYTEIKNKPRAGHADDVWKNKFGISDHRGGGRSSGRETVCRVLAGSLAQMMIRQINPQLQIHAYLSQIGSFFLTDKQEQNFLNELGRQSNSFDETKKILKHPVDAYFARFPTDDSSVLKSALLKAQSEGESFGAVIKVVIRNAPANLGQPVFHKLKSDLTAALMSIGAVHAVQLGVSNSFEKGSEFHGLQDQKQYGGIRGGISTGEDIHLSLQIKPTSSILDIAKKGRHDPCIGIRAIPVVESMIALVLADHLLWQRLDRI
jgi:chorismate synthase